MSFSHMHRILVLAQAVFGTLSEDLYIRFVSHENFRTIACTRDPVRRIDQPFCRLDAHTSYERIEEQSRRNLETEVILSGTSSNEVNQYTLIIFGGREINTNNGGSYPIMSIAMGSDFARQTGGMTLSAYGISIRPRDPSIACVGDMVFLQEQMNYSALDEQPDQSGMLVDVQIAAPRLEGQEVDPEYLLQNDRYSLLQIVLEESDVSTIPQDQFTAIVEIIENLGGIVTRNDSGFYDVELENCFSRLTERDQLPDLRYTFKNVGEGELVDVLNLHMFPEDYLEPFHREPNRCRLAVAPAENNGTEDTTQILKLGPHLQKNLIIYFDYNERQFGICEG